LDARAESQTVKRLRYLARFCCLWGGVLLTRLIFLQVVNHEDYQRLAQQQQEHEVEIDAPRGDILDRNGQRLAMSLPVDSVCVNPLRIPDLPVAAQLLSRVLKLNEQELLEKMAAAADAHRGFLWVKRKIGPEESESIRSLNLDWVEYRRESRRFYPKGALASHVIGSVDHEEKGNAGIEQNLNDDLSGKPGVARNIADVRGGVVSSVVFTDAQPGKKTTLTIDERIQYVAEMELRRAVEINNCRTGSVVVVNPNTGEVLAMANAMKDHEPFDPNKPVMPGEPIENRQNLAISAPFEPGSVFKVVTLSAAMEKTKLTPSTPIFCGNGVITLFKRVIHDAHPHGTLTVQEVLEKSSNIGAIQIGLQVGDQNLYDYVKRFGFGKQTGISLPGESNGLVWPLKKWIPSSIGSVAMGHEVLTTTLQLALACSAVANGGTLMHPRLVVESDKPNSDPMADGTRVVKPETAAIMRSMMQGVVLQGTGKAAQLRGYSSAGKTGSAQIYDHSTRTYSHKYNASFMGFAPVNRPAIVVVVTLNGASKFGGAVAAPVFEKIASASLRFLDVPKDLPDREPAPVVEEPESDLAIADLGGTNLAPDEDASETAPQVVRAAVGPQAPTRVFGPELPPPPPVQVRAAAKPAGPKAPDFRGKTLRDVLEESTALGIKVEFKGTGIARLQQPAAGSVLRAGEHMRVIFAR